MKYDLEKCDNLNFRLNDRTTGFVKVSPIKELYLYSNKKRGWDLKRSVPYFEILTGLRDRKHADYYLNERGLEIIPRDPETYQDWKVGDRFMKDGRVFEIRVEDNGFFFAISDVGFLTGRTDYLFSGSGARLVLTDYEKELIHAQEPKKKKACPFKNGDRVLVRDNDDAPWQHDIFYFYEEESSLPYCCEIGQVKQCIPFNEHTWQLLGTTDEYKEEE